MHQVGISDVSEGSNPADYTFCTSILNRLYFAGDTSQWNAKARKPWHIKASRHKTALPNSNNDNNLFRSDRVVQSHLNDYRCQCLQVSAQNQIEAQRSGFDLERRSKEAGGWRLFCHRHKKTSEQSGLCSDVVRVVGLEPTRLSAEEPKGDVTSVANYYSIVNAGR